MTQKRRGRPATGHDPTLTLRMSPELREAVDAYAASEGAPRSSAIRTALTDWLRTHGFMKADMTEPVGPATKVVDAMDAAIAKDRTGRRKR